MLRLGSPCSREIRRNISLRARPGAPDTRTPEDKADLRDALVTLVSSATLALGIAYFAAGLFTVRPRSLNPGKNS